MRNCWALTVLLCLVVTGCSSSNEGKPEEVPSSEAVNLDATQEALFQTAQKLYQKGLYSVATDSYTALKNGYPVGAYAEYAELKLADAEFNAANYEDAAPLYENFIKDHPASKSTPYAIYQAARSHQSINRGVGRDPSPLYKSVELYDRLLAQYPESIYTQSAKEQRIKTLEQLALHEQMVIDFYGFQEKTDAVQARKVEFDEKWARYIGAPADEKITTGDTVYAANTVEEQSTRAQLAADAPELLAAARSADENPSAPLLDQENQEQLLEPPTTPSTAPQSFSVGGVKCKERPTKMVVVHFGSAVQLEKLEAQAGESPLLTPVEGRISCALPEGNYKPITKNCFGHQDLRINDKGILSVQSDQPARKFTLDNPPRLFVIWTPD
ncbi:MAG: outer membrane protein assembly factor BamD [Deltaproteobacteria bacterium]|nr:outer membrane protein assembly factor BamD [Deltaproteobacteria bacterium]